MHVPIKVKSSNNISNWQMEFNLAFKGLSKVQITRITLNFNRERKILPASVICKGKVKAIPLQGWTVPKDSRGLRFPDLKTFGHIKVVKAVSPTHRPPLPPGTFPGTYFG
jgi:hypothetical protein